MADLIFNKFKEWMADGTLDLDTDAFKVALFSSSSLPAATQSPATYTAVNGAKTQVSSGSGYTTGGASLSTPTWVLSGATVTFDAVDTAWSSATFTARWALIYDTTHASSGIVALIDFGTSKSVTAGTFTIQWHSSGIFTLT